MIDRPSRNQLAEALRALASGQVSNDEFERRVPMASSDPAVWHIFFDGVWGLYSDLWEHRLKDTHRLKPRARAAVWRFISRTAYEDALKSPVYLLSLRSAQRDRRS